jgi:hypothetical protein
MIFRLAVGLWEPSTYRRTDDGGANLFCPDGHSIGHVIPIAKLGPSHSAHTVGLDGCVTPSVASTVCDFHDWVCLDGWMP